VVLDLWVLTTETNVFGEIENGEDQITWEAMTPMEKNIPLWFQMEVGCKLYDTKSKEVKAEVDRCREREKADAITAMGMTFSNNEERLQIMR
jgi:hypothetical protein